ncbi:MAG TPA: hypothetical protein VHR46_11035 [Gaiella sp.]|nr:hypothetical protein [Gaiella sp.]
MGGWEVAEGLSDDVVTRLQALDHALDQVERRIGMRLVVPAQLAGERGRAEAERPETCRDEPCQGNGRGRDPLVVRDRVQVRRAVACESNREPGSWT